MFAAAEMHKVVSKADYKAQVPELREALLGAQYDLLMARKFPVLVIFGGVEGAGKSETIHTLNEWLDPRHVETHGFLWPSDEETQRPPMYRFWRALPPKGQTAFFLGSWYTLPIASRAMNETSEAELDQSIKDIRYLERMLYSEGVLILKFWLHISKREESKRIRAMQKDPRKSWRVTEEAEVVIGHYDELLRAAEKVLRETSTGEVPWTVVDGYDHRHRTLTIGRALLDAMQRRHAEPEESRLVTSAPVRARGENVGLIRNLDLTQRLERDEYKAQIEKYQDRFAYLVYGKEFRKRSLVLAFEGSDAAGKGGTIRRVTGALDAHFYKVVPVAAPTEEERAQPYLWRFWRHAPGNRDVVIFDRSWYGRVLVERVEGFSSEADWMRAYNEINSFEDQLVRNGAVICKFWLQISKEEQLRRFEERQQTGFKRFKITEEDWRNREQWDAYEQAVADMIDRTSTSAAPWTLVEANDKRFARVKVLRTVCEALERAL